MAHDPVKAIADSLLRNPHVDPQFAEAFAKLISAAGMASFAYGQTIPATPTIAPMHTDAEHIALARRKLADLRTELLDDVDGDFPAHDNRLSRYLDLVDAADDLLAALADMRRGG